MPGAGGPFMRPTDRPTEPVTAGLGVGAGPGPEAIAPMGQAPPGTLGQMLGRLAAAPNAPSELRDLASSAQVRR